MTALAYRYGNPGLLLSDVLPPGSPVASNRIDLLTMPEATYSRVAVMTNPRELDYDDNPHSA